MTAPDRLATVGLPGVLAWIGAVALVALTIVLYLVGDGPWPASTMRPRVRRARRAGGDRVG